MIIFVDTRQKQGKHDKKHEQMKEMGAQLEFKALKIGDYMAEDKPHISIDTKQNMQEVYSNVVNDKSRFMKEVRRAFENKIKLYVLVEHGGAVKNINDVAKWKPKYGHMSAVKIMRRMIEIHIAYGVEWVFCDKRSTGRKIIELLKGAQT